MLLSRLAANELRIGRHRGVVAVSGDPFDDEIRPGRQDHLVRPDQPWLDGVDAGEGMVRRFVGVPLGGGAKVEGQLTTAPAVSATRAISPWQATVTSEDA